MTEHDSDPHVRKPQLALTGDLTGDAEADLAHDTDSEADEEGLEIGGLSLEELSQSYTRALRSSEADTAASVNQVSSLAGPRDEIAADAELEIFEDEDADTDDDQACPVTPRSILEAILFVGRPDGGSIAAAEVAALMRGVNEAEIQDLVLELNTSYEKSSSAIRISEDVDGFRVILAADLEHVRERFYGRVRETRLNQAAIDCLALIAYQPGISRSKLEEQRGQPSGTVLNQLVRRQLIEMRREGDPKQLTACYYPAEKLLQLSGLASLDDLPQAEEF